MKHAEKLPELKEIVGALLFAAKQPLTPAQARRIIKQTAELEGGMTADYAVATEKQVRVAFSEFAEDINGQALGLQVHEVAGGYRLVNDGNCGRWVRRLLQKDRPQKLSRPALETLAIIAYRQPCLRSEIESVRGVAVDGVLKSLMEIQLVRIVGRSELPGRPFLFGTTQKFLEQFGIRSLDDLPNSEELRRIKEAQDKEDAQPSGEVDAAPELDLSGAEPASTGASKPDEEEASA